jgi:hypothetical protein
MERDQFLIFGSSEALTQFSSAATDGGFQVERRDITALSADQVALECLRIVFSPSGAVVFGALAAVIRAYLQFKASRRVTVTKFEGDKLVSIDARGLSEDQLKELLPHARELHVYDGDETNEKT